MEGAWERCDRVLLGHFSQSVAGDGGGGEIPLHGEAHHHQHLQQGEVQQPLEEDVVCPHKGEEDGGRREACAAEKEDCQTEELRAVEEGEGLEYGKSTAEEIDGRATKRFEEVEGKHSGERRTGESPRGANGLLDNSWGRSRGNDSEDEDRTAKEEKCSEEEHFPCQEEAGSEEESIICFKAWTGEGKEQRKGDG